MGCSAYRLGTTHTETNTVKIIPNGYIDSNTDEFQENYINMRKVTYFKVEDGLQLYYEDGGGYYLER